jgi:hypothetical protein
MKSIDLKTVSKVAAAIALVAVLVFLGTKLVSYFRSAIVAAPPAAPVATIPVPVTTPIGNTPNVVSAPAANTPNVVKPAAPEPAAAKK